jgi:hypothetical protein
MVGGNFTVARRVMLADQGVLFSTTSSSGMMSWSPPPADGGRVAIARAGQPHGSLRGSGWSPR